MNKLVVVLAASTAASAATALYYRHELIEERSRAAQVEAPGTLVADAPAPVVITPEPPAPPEPSAKPAVPPASRPPPALADRPSAASTQSSALPECAGAPPPLSDARRAEMRQRAEQFLKKYEDPEGRAELREQAVTAARRNLKGFDKERNLDGTTFEKLIQLMADQDMERRLLQSRCFTDADCTVPAGYRELQAANKEAVTALIGTDGYEAMRDWSASVPDRRMLSQLANRMPANLPLTPDQSAALISALAQERKTAIQEFAATRQHYLGYGNVDGTSVMYMDEAPSMDERMSSARTYSQRMRDRAATVLNGEQLMVFNQMQDELLFDLQRHLRNRENQRREGS